MNARARTCYGLAVALLLEGVQEAVHKLLLEAAVDVPGAQVGHDLLDGVQHHLAVGLAFVLQVLQLLRLNWWGSFSRIPRRILKEGRKWRFSFLPTKIIL